MKPPVLSEEKLKKWVVYRTGSTFLYDHEKGVLLDMIEQAKEEVAREVVDWLMENDKHNRFGFEDGTLLLYKEDWQAKLQEWGITSV